METNFGLVGKGTDRLTKKRNKINQKIGYGIHSVLKAASSNDAIMKIAIMTTKMRM